MQQPCENQRKWLGFYGPNFLDMESLSSSHLGKWTSLKDAGAGTGTRGLQVRMRSDFFLGAVGGSKVTFNPFQYLNFDQSESTIDASMMLVLTYCNSTKVTTDVSQGYLDSQDTYCIKILKQTTFDLPLFLIKNFTNNLKEFS